MHQLLASSFAWPCDDNRCCQTVVWNDWGELLLPLCGLLAFLPACLLLRLGPLGRSPATFRAEVVIAVGALVAGAERSLTSMTVFVNANAYGLFYSVYIALNRVPFAGLDLYTIVGAESPGAILMDLGSRHPSRTLILRIVWSSHLGQRFGAGGMSACSEQ